MSAVGLRGATAIVGVANLHYPRGGAEASERVMLLQAILEACADAGISRATSTGSRHTPG